MKTINVDKKQLLKTLKKNKATHEKEHKEFLKDYKEQVIARIEEFLEEAKKTVKKDKPVNRSPEQVPFPKNYSDAYDRAMDMLEWHNQDSIELTEAEFRNFVQDEWDWSQEWETSKSYLSSNR